MPQQWEHLNEPVTAHIRADYAALEQSLTVQGALETVRQRGVGEKIIYFYVVDEENRLTGVVPTRRLLIASPEQRLSDLMISKVVAIPQTATLVEACEFFVLYKFLAFPVVDEQRHMIGVIDVSVFTEEVFDLAERDQMDELFQSLGFRVAQVRNASPLRAFTLRFPWLLATLASGTICAFLAQQHELTLAKSLVLAFFLTLVLGLGESVSVQSMTLAVQALRTVRPSWPWFARAFAREFLVAAMLGLASGGIVALVVRVWMGGGMPPVAIGLSLLLALISACLIGLAIPTLLNVLKLDLKIAAGPVTLAITDVMTLLFYFNLAARLL